MHTQLRWHPDRNSEPEATARFQSVANAYYILGDATRRAAYDVSLTDSADTPLAAATSALASVLVDPFKIFASVFDDLLIPEVPNPTVFYERIGCVSGIVLGFILLNIPGAIIGYYTGAKMGKVRDMKGKCVYDAFMKLDGGKKREILTHLASKLVKHTVL
jgi:hypothetical protein